MHVALATSGQVINELANDASQPCSLNGRVDGALESWGAISKPKCEPLPHIEGFWRADSCERYALGIHGDLPEPARQVKFIELVKGGDFGEYISGVGDRVAVSACL